MRTYSPPSAYFLLVLFLLSSCVDKVVNISPTNVPTPMINSSYAAKMDSLVPTIMPSPVPWPTSDPSWKTYTNSDLRVEFNYPPDWHLTSSNSLEGQDGFARLEILTNNGSDPDTFCEMEANLGKPEAFGKYPKIIGTCLILPSDDQPSNRHGEAVYYLWFPPNIHPNSLLALHADRSHILAIAQSLHFTNYSTLSVEEGRKGNQCDYKVSGAVPHELQRGGLKVEEYPISGPATCNPLDDAEAFYGKMRSGKGAKPADNLIHDMQAIQNKLNDVNSSLAPFGYTIQLNENTYEINQNGKLVLRYISWLGQLTVNTSGTDFILPIRSGETFLLRPDGIHQIDPKDPLANDFIFPIFLGDEQIRLQYSFYPPNFSFTVYPTLVNVKKKGQIIYTFSIPSFTPASGPVQGLWAWDGHWIMKVAGVIIEDGRILNEELGYPEMFSWWLMNGKPFYFFRKEGKINVSYNDQKLDLSYDEVINKPLCCSSALLKMHKLDNGLLFFAQRDEIWYYVILTMERP